MGNNYYDNPAISASGLKVLTQTPAHYYARFLDPEREPYEPTPAMEFGTAVHCACLEPSEFDNRYACIPEGLSLATKEGKAVRDGILAVGKKPLKYDDMQRILKMQKSVQSSSLMSLLDSSYMLFEREHYYYYDGISAKMKPDLIIQPCEQYPNGLIIDLKTTTSAAPDYFARQCFNLKMYLQAAFYTESFLRIYGAKPPFYWLPVENKAPFLTASYKAPQHLIDFGNEECERLLTIYKECLDTGVWYGYGDGVNDLVLPSWAESIISGGGEVEISFVDDEDSQ